MYTLNYTLHSGWTLWTKSNMLFWWHFTIRYTKNVRVTAIFDPEPHYQYCDDMLKCSVFKLED